MGGISHWTKLITTEAQQHDDIKLTVVDISPRWRAVHDLGLLKRSIGGGLQTVT